MPQEKHMRTARSKTLRKQEREESFSNEHVYCKIPMSKKLQQNWDPRTFLLQQHLKMHDAADSQNTDHASQAETLQKLFKTHIRTNKKSAYNAENSSNKVSPNSNSCSTRVHLSKHCHELNHQFWSQKHADFSLSLSLPYISSFFRDAAHWLTKESCPTSSQTGEKESLALGWLWEGEGASPAVHRDRVIPRLLLLLLDSCNQVNHPFSFRRNSNFWPPMEVELPNQSALLLLVTLRACKEQVHPDVNSRQ